MKCAYLSGCNYEVQSRVSIIIIGSCFLGLQFVDLRNIALLITYVTVIICTGQIQRVVARRRTLGH